MIPILQVSNLVTRFYTMDGIVHAVNGISFDLEEGETLAIVGESGCGKTVTMLSLLGLIPEQSGKIKKGKALFSNNNAIIDLLKLSTSGLRQIRGGQIGIVFQDPMTSLHPTLTIGLQITESMIEHMGISPIQAYERTLQLLDRVGMSDPEEQYGNYPHQLSGGMRQRVMIAIAISCNPKILIADEPTTALDVTIQAQIIELVKKLRTEMSLSVIWITHNLGVVAGLADRVLVMYGGLMVEQASVDELFKNPKHPYTIGLLGALPRLDEAGFKPLVNIEGYPPELLAPPSHCIYADRCSSAIDICWHGIPFPYSVGDEHLVACFVYQNKE
jgi:oligopeptide transport system ATP-binding protein